MSGVNKKLIYSIASIAIFLIILFFLKWAVTPSADAIFEGWVVSHDGITEEVELPNRKTVYNDSAWVYKVEFDAPDLQQPALLISRPLTYAIEVRLNGDTISKISDIEQPAANLWNHCLLIPINQQISGKNTLEIITAPLNLTGLTVVPYFLEYEEAQQKAFFINFILNDITLLSVGGSPLLGVLLILLAITRKSSKDAAIYIGVASIAAAIYCLDYQYKVFGGSAAFLLAQKKICLFCGYFSAGSFLFAICTYSNCKKKILIPIIILTAATCIGILAAWDIHVLFRVFNFSNFILLLNLIFGVIILLQISSDRVIFLFPMWLLALSILQVIIGAVRGTSEPLTMQYMLLISIIFFSIHILLDFNSIFAENKKLAIGLNKDPLTGVFNRRFLKRMNPKHWNCVVLTDLDNFKYYNDTYGHARGDYILRLFVKIVEENLRSNDLIMRYGGDEFLIFLAEVETDQAEKILSRIAVQFKNEIDDSKVGISYGLCNLGHNIDDSIMNADMGMYKMKNIRKNRIHETAIY